MRRDDYVLRQSDMTFYVLDLGGELEETLEGRRRRDVYLCSAYPISRFNGSLILQHDRRHSNLELIYLLHFLGSLKDVKSAT